MDILNLASGNKTLVPEDFPEGFIVNVDKSYPYDLCSDFDDIVRDHVDYLLNETEEKTLNYSGDVFEFLEKYPQTFEYVASFRFFEHVGKFDLLHFIYQVANITDIDGHLDIIVPNYVTLARRILNEEIMLNTHLEKGVLPRSWENEDIITTTEIVNTPDMPHASIWTPERAKYYLELEGRFKIIEIDENYEFDGRDLYMRIISKRV